MSWTRITRAAAVLALAAAALPATAGAQKPQHNAHYCDGCQPPLKYGGGAIMDTTGPQGVVVTPIYWEPPGAEHRFPPGYVELINRYVADVAADSGTDGNVYSILPEYYGMFGGARQPIHYRFTAGTPVVDTNPLPRSGCDPSPGYAACITDAQLVAELDKVLRERNLPRGLAHFYPMFFPPGVETDDGSGLRSLEYFCAYHYFAGEGADTIIYSNEPYDAEGSCTGQAPNGNPAADTAIDNLSHELNEVVTDPLAEGGWLDATGAENADICASDYGPPLGSTDPKSPQNTAYNQVINGNRYYTQTAFSNVAFRRLGFGLGCHQSLATVAGATPDEPIGRIYFNPGRNALRADGRSTSELFVQVMDKDGFAVENDRVSFTTYILRGRGSCGRIRPRAVMTDSAGTVSATYRASKSNIPCVIVANDSMGGKSAAAVIYQGTSRARAPRARETFPRLFRKRRTQTFTTTFSNPTGRALTGSQVVFYVFPPSFRSPNVRAGSIALSVSMNGRKGPFVPVKLTGATQSTAGISGTIGGKAGFTFAARRRLTLTFRMRVGRKVRLRRQPVLQLEAFLLQVNPASGAEAVLADTGPGNALVR